MIFSKKTFFLLLLVLMLLFPALVGATRVIDKSSTANTLQSKWDKALADGLKQKKDFWLAFSDERLMAENRYLIATSRITGSITLSPNSPNPDFFNGEPLGKLLYGKDFIIRKPQLRNQKEQITDAAKRAIAHLKNKDKKQIYKKVVKEIAILFLIQPGTGKEPVKVRQSDMSFPFGNDGKPIYWLGKTGKDNGLGFLINLFPTLTQEKSKRGILAAIGNYSNPSKVIPFMEKVVNSSETDSVRARAANELGDQNDLSAVDVLLKIALNDHSLEVRRKAVNALEDLDFPQTVDALIHIARKANNAYIRKKAINTLADVGTQKAADALYEITFKDPDIEIQRKAVNAFEDLPNKAGVAYLIKIAKTHPNPYIRKKAINSLGDIKDPRAYEAILAIAKQK